MRRIKLITPVLLLALGLLLLFIAGADSSAQSGPQASKPDSSSLAPSLRSFSTQAPLTPAEEATARALHIWAGPQHVRVILEGEKDLRLPPGVELEYHSGDLYQVRAPRTMLGKLAAQPGVRRVRPPLPHATDFIVSEGVWSSGANNWVNQGWNGSGQSVVVIDIGFSGWQDLQSHNELPSFVSIRNFRGDGHFETTTHGAAVSEIVYDVAPGASLSLFAIDTELELEQAVDTAIAQNADVIVHAVSWFNTGAGNGTGVIADQVRRADDAGILWVNAAGNQAREYYQGYFTPSSSNPNRHAFTPNDEGNDVTLNAGDTICGMLSWDAWPATADDYDLYLYRGGQWVARSDEPQTGTEPPTEALCYTAGVSDVYNFVIVHYSLDYPPVLMRLFVSGANLQYNTIAGSIVQPADAPQALATGAIFWLKPFHLESFSSRGPTTDGRIKPDLAAYDGVSTRTYGYTNYLDYDHGGTGFFGTSASAPLVGGAAALVRQRFPHWSTAEIRNFLTSRAIDMGDPGPDNAYGSGRLNLPESLTPTATATITPTVTVTPTSTPTMTPSPTPTPTPTPTIGPHRLYLPLIRK